MPKTKKVNGLRFGRRTNLRDGVKRKVREVPKLGTKSGIRKSMH